MEAPLVVNPATSHPTDRSVSTGSDEDVPRIFRQPVRSVERLRLIAVSLSIVLMTFAQSSGSTAADTKIDLTVDPLQFLRRALTLWDPSGNAGQLQNQAYGYLFPVGPFYVLCHWLGLAPWSAQRLWQSALVLAAFLGVVRLARLLGVAGFWPRVGAGLAYSLAPQMLTELSSISAALTPTAALPWILIPLVRGADSGSPRKAAALSGVALLFAGGTNAAATLAVLPAAALWLLTRERGPRRTALTRYWFLAVTLSCMWWALPLVLLGRYSPPFLDWIEAAQNTTATTSLSATLRGVEHWEAYLGPRIWPAGWILVSAPAAIIATTLVAGAGLYGLARRHVPNRMFLFACLGLGLALLSFGHAAAMNGPFAGTARNLLDGPLVAFRNIHKFDALVRLPLAIGIGLVLATTKAPWWRSFNFGSLHLRVPARVLAVSLALAAAVVAITPAVGNRLVPEPRANALASWWHDTGHWLSQHGDGSRALVVPGAARPTYFWGETIDDALQPVTTAPWIVRSAAPLAEAGTIRLMDMLEARLATGHGDASLAELMARSGIGYVVVRNDLDTTDSLATPYNIVRTTLRHSPGFTPVAGFGPELGGGPTPAQLVDGGAGVPRPAVEIYRVVPASGLVGLLPSEGAVLATGSSDAVGQLVDRGLPATTPVLFGNDQRALVPKDSVRVATDGIRREQAGFGNALVKSQTLARDESYDGSRKAYDYLPDDHPALSTMRYLGIAGVSASSSGADVYAALNRGSANGPWAALDGNAGTAWRTGSSRGAVGQWIEVRLAQKLVIDSVRVAFVEDLSGYPAQIDVRTDTGQLMDPVRATSATQVLTLPLGPTKTIRMTIRSMSLGGFGTSAGISELSIPGVVPSRTLDVPNVGAPAIMAFDAAPGYRDGCLDVAGQPACDAALGAAGEEDVALDRTVQLANGQSYRAEATVRLLASSAVNSKLDALLPVRASASSVASNDPRGRPGAAVDGDPATTWSAAADDHNPSLTLDLRESREVHGLRIQADPASSVAAPRSVRVDAGTQHWTGPVPAGGTIELDHPVRTRTLKITVLTAQIRTSVSTLTGQTRLLPAGISTITVTDDAPPAEARLPDTLDFGCSDGLILKVDGTPIPLRIKASASDVLDGEPVRAVACTANAIDLSAGEHRFTLAASEWALPRSLTLSTFQASLSAPAPSPGTATVQTWKSTNRRVLVNTSAPSLLVVRENFNSGWRASVDGVRMPAVRVDGWQQAFAVPQGTQGIVVLTYAPQRMFSLGLILGLAAVVALGLLILWPSRKCSFGALGEGRLQYPVQVALLAALVMQLTGLAGVAVLAVAIVVRHSLWASHREVPPWLCGLAFFTVGTTIASAPLLSRFAVANSDTNQLLALAAVCFAAIAGLPPPRR
jgi:arabinofuranan 3-O-arabinosyltransferase